MKFGFIAKHRGIWPVDWLCGALGVSRSGFHAWLMAAQPAQPERRRARREGSRELLASDRTYGARRYGATCLRRRVVRLHRIERDATAGAQCPPATASPAARSG